MKPTRTHSLDLSLTFLFFKNEVRASFTIEKFEENTNLPLSFINKATQQKQNS